jgi:hypothetical protein
MNKINKYLFDNTYSAFSIIMQHGLYHALEDKKSVSDYLQLVINIQTAFELLLKMDIISTQHDGWKIVFPDSKNPKFIGKNEDEILEMFKSNDARSEIYSKILKDIFKYKWYDFKSSDKNKLKSLEYLRNGIVHAGFGLDKIKPEITNDVLILMIKLFNELFVFLEKVRQRSNNYLEEMIGSTLLNKLISNKIYKSDCLKYVNENYDDSKYCLYCENKSMVYDKSDDTWYCLLCGSHYSGVDFIDCNNCMEKGSVIFDTLNFEGNDFVPGKCCRCQNSFSIAKCKVCGKYYDYFDGTDARCPNCA